MASLVMVVLEDGVERVMFGESSPLSQLGIPTWELRAVSNNYPGQRSTATASRPMHGPAVPMAETLHQDNSQVPT